MADEKAQDVAKEKPKEAQGQAPPQQPHREPRKEQRPQQRATSIIRMGGRDINGELGVERALAHIKGIGHDMAHSISFAVESRLGIQKDTKIGSLSESQMESIESVIKDPAKYGIPTYMLNRRKSADTGTDVHIIGNDLMFATRQDVNRDIAVRAWRGYRHQHGQKVRGQRTRSTGRTGATVGVMKKAVKQQMAAAAQEKGKEAAPAAKK